MSKSVDERVVQMRFDNQQFESNVKTTMGTLDRLKQALKLDDSTKSVKDLDNSFKNFTGLDGIAKGVESLQKRFSTLGIIGMRVVQNLTDAAMNFAGKTMSFVSDSIVQGGINRAMNIENAHFMLQGLLHDEEKVQAIMDQASKSVDGTAYSYDAAAKAASMFTASGIQQGEQLEKALAALAGTAATTNSDYESMSQIFTTVAGQGRLMGDQLLQLASRGMNAAATLTNYFKEVKGESNITESEIRQMVSDGKIDFETFAEAMNWAFGDQAQKANKTFTGAMANIKAALARTGQGFVSPLIEQQSQFVKLFNRIRMSINDFNSTLAPMQTDFSNAMLGMAKNARLFLKEINFQKVGKSVQNGIYTVVNLFKGLGSVLTPIKGAFQDIFPPTTVSNAVNSIMNFTQHMRTLSESFRLNETDSKNLQATFRGVFTIVNFGVQVFKLFGSALLTVIKNVAGLVSPLLSVTGSVGNWITSIGQAKSVTELFGEASKALNSAIDGAFKGINAVFSTFASGVSTHLEGSIGIVDKVKDAFSRLGSVFDKVAPVLSTIGKLVGGAFQQLGSALSKAFSGGGFNSLYTLINSGLLVGISTGLSAFIKNINHTVSEAGGVFTSIKDFPNKMKEVIDQSLKPLLNVLEAYQSNLKASVLIKIAVAVGILAGSLALLSSIKPENMLTGLTGITVLFGELYGFMLGMDKMMASGGIKSLTKVSLAMIGMSISIGILASALKKLSDLNMDQIANGVVAIGALMTELVVMSAALSKWGGKVQTSALGMILFATAINILASAVKKIADMDTGAMVQGLAGVGAIMAEMAGFAVVAGGTKNMVSIGIGMNLLAASMMTFSKAISELGNMNVEVLKQGLMGMAAALGEVAIALNLLPKNTMSIGAGLLVVSGALTVIGGVVNSLGGLSWDELARGLVGLGGSLGILAIAMNAMNGTLGGSAAMLVMAAALAVFIPPFMLLSQLSLPQIAAGLIALAGAFTILGVAGAVLGPIAPAILAISGALALLGVSILAVGAGVTMFAAGMATLAASGVAGALALQTIITMIAGMVPLIATTIAQGVITFVTTIAEGSAQIVEAVVELGSALLSAVTELAPQMAETATTVIMAFLEAANTCLPEIVEVGLNLITNLLEGIASRMGDITNAGIDIIVNFLNAVSGRIGEVIQAGIDLMVNFINGLADGIRNNQEAVSEAVRNLVTAMIEAAVGMAADFGATALDFIAALADGLLGAVQTVIDAGLDLVAQVLKAIGVPDEWVDTGRNFIQGLIDGLFDFVKNAVDAAKDVGKRILKGIKESLKINSPSKATKEVGGYFIQGLTNGITEDTPKAVQAAKDAGQQTVTVLNGQVKDGVEDLAKTLGIGKESVGDFTKAFSEAMKDVGDSSIAFTIAKNSVDAHTESTEKNTKSTKENSEEVKKKAEQLAKAIEAEQKYGDVMNWAGDVVKAYNKEHGRIVALEEGKRQALAVSKEAVMQYAEQIYAAQQTAANATEQSAKNSEEIKSHAQAVAEAFVDLRQKIEETIQSQMDIFSAYDKKNDISSEDMLKNMKSQVKGVSDWADNLTKLGDRGINKGLLEKLGELGPSGADKVAAFVKMTDKQLKQASHLYAKSLQLPQSASAQVVGSFAAAGQQCVAGFNNGIVTTGATGNATQLGTNTLGALETALEEHSPSRATQRMGENLNAGLINGLNTSSPAVNTAVSNLGKTIVSELNKAFKTTDMSKIDLVTPIVKSINSKKQTAVAAAKGVCTAVVTTFKSNLASSRTIGAGTTAITGVVKGMNSKKATLTAAVKTICSGVVTSFKTEFSAAKFSPVMSSAMQGLVTGMNSKKSALVSAAKTIATAIVKEFKEQLKAALFTKIGTDAMNALIKGMNSKKSAAVSAGKAIGKAVLKAVKDNMKKSDFKKIGEDAALGLKEGIESKIDEVAKAAIKAAKKAVTSAKKELDENSPSKVFFEIGRFIDEGLINGIERYTDNVGVAGRHIAQATINAMNDSVDYISEAFSDTTLDPIVTPIIDLSEVRRGATMMDGMFAANRSIDLSSDIRSINLSRSGMIDELGEKLGRLNATGTDAVTAAIGELRSDVAELSRQMTNLQVVMDTGTLVGAISPEMDTRLGMMETYKGRGI